ncbi:MAG: zinc-dependent metalloprotease [Leadbetterella sp.]|nr:zinc-dependent metalloprotease [Leadbetterella sp.]
MSMMGELIRFVSSHEVGHTLGLRHNMGASNATPVEKLRDPEFQEKNGHTSSIMDYARFNYVAQPEDGVKHFFPKIGDYDKWAIKWGYTYFPDAKSAEEEKALLHKLTNEAIKNPRLRFGTETSPFDPRYQTEDLGDNAVKASEYGIKNLKRILPELEKWSREDGESYSELNSLYNSLTGQFRRYMGHVTKYVGGIYDTPVTYDSESNRYEIVPKELQVEAVNFLNAQLFTTPKWIIDQNILSKIRPENGVEAIKTMQVSTLNSLLATDRATRLMEASSQGNKYYSLDDLYTALKSGIFSELKSGSSIDIFRRNLQKAFVSSLTKQLNANPVPGRPDFTQTDLSSITRGTLVSLKSELSAASSRISDKVSKYHVQDLVARINEALEKK